MKKAPYFIRAGALGANQDVKLYDVGNLFVCTQAQANTNVIGELYIEYDVLLMTPQLSDVSVGGSLYLEYASTVSTNAAPFGIVATGNLQAALVSTGGTTSLNTITFTNPFAGVVSWGVSGTGISAVAQGGTAARAENRSTFDAAGDTAVGSIAVTATAGQTITITITNTTLTSGDLMIGQGSFA